MIEVVAPATRDDDLAETLAVALGERRRLMRTLLERAAREGLLRTDVETGIDLLLGGIYYRHLLSHGPLTAEYLAAIVDTVVGSNP